uniref:Putative small cys-rich protein n=1 Tax=Hyaloperonospora parasitica TaxID=123356 RepID=A2T2K3_9STRA|nr:putative small cys-rich protein [Hyaloperonospora parasitica]
MGRTRCSRCALCLKLVCCAHCGCLSSSLDAIQALCNVRRYRSTLALLAGG